MAQTNVQAFSGDVEISGETVLGTATYRKKLRWNRNALAYVYLGNIQTNKTTGIRLDVALNAASSGYEMYQFQITLSGNDDSHAGGKMIYSALGGDTGSNLKSVEIGYVYVGGGGEYEYQLWLKDPITDTTGQIDVYLNCQDYYNFDTGVSDVAQGGAAPTNFNLGTPGVAVDKFGNVGIGTNEPEEALHVAGNIRLGAAEGVDDDNLKSIVTTSPLEVHSNAEDLDGLGVSLNLRSGFSDSESNIQMLSSKSNSTFQYISFATATQERMRITSGGNVGIGSTNPGAKLDVKDGITIKNYADTGFSNVIALSIQAKSSDYTSITNGYGSKIQFRTNRGTNADGSAASAEIKGYVWSGGGSGVDYHALDLDVYGDNSSLNKGISILSESNSGGPAKTIMHGRVGIGTTNPETELELHKRHGSDSLGTTSAIKFSTNNDAAFWDVCSIRGAITLNNGGNSNYPGGFVFATKSPGSSSSDLTDRMVIDANGNVGIGTNNPTNKLEVVGTMVSNSIRLGTGSFGYQMKKFGLNNGSVSFVFNLRVICNWGPGIVKIKAAANDGSGGTHYGWNWTYSFRTVFCGTTTLIVGSTLEGGNPGASLFEHSLNPNNGLYTLTALAAGRDNVVAECEILHFHGIYS